MNQEQIEYIKGFEHGCDYIVAEIERYALNYDGAPNIMLRELIAHLKMENLQNVVNRSKTYTV